jgi:hypothetical protein
MKPTKSLLPQAGDISDEAALVLTDFLYQLATACEFRYLAKIRRHTDAVRAAEIDKLDPDRPWCRRPPPV